MRTFGTLFVMLAFVSFSGAVFAGDAYTLYTSDLADVCVNDVDTVDVDFGLDTSDGDDLVGYSWGVCHSEDTLSLDEDNVVNGGTVDDIEFFFHSLSYYDEGWTVGSLFSLSGFVLEPGDYSDMYAATYNVDADGDATIDFCGDLGSPTVALAVVVGSDEIEPATDNGAFTVLAEDDEECSVPAAGFNMAASDETIEYSVDTGAGSGATTISISEDEEADGYPNDTKGFQLGLVHDADYLEPTGVESAGALDDLNGGDGPDFLGDDLDPDDGTGVTVGVVFSFTGDADLAFDSDGSDVLTVSYDTNTETLAGDDTGATTTLAFSSELGDPVVEVGVVVGTDLFGAATTGATITLDPSSLPSFIRGDANANGSISILDPIFTAEAVYQDGAEITCMASADSNSDDKVDTGDVLYTLQYIFTDGDAPESPFPGCGIDEDVDEDMCASHAFCD